MRPIGLYVLGICFLTVLLLPSPVAADGETWEWEVDGNPSAVITKTHLSDSVQFTIVISYTPGTCPTPYYGVGIAFATSLDNPAFQVWYREYATPYGWYYQEWTGTGYLGWGGAVVPLSAKPGFSAEGSNTGNTFTITVPLSALGGCDHRYYFAIQFRTPTPCTGTMNSLPTGLTPPGNIWDLEVSSYLYQEVPCPRAYIAVGGILVPTNSFEILIPYLALAGLVMAISAVLVVKRRKSIYLS
ncbi:MAG: hypothetical protein NWF08_02265 [Candidatus Bathyarchaeota archaeon]|nr:hypothetical protein [Candidatus Bathyarchaeota archaeon]